MCVISQTNISKHSNISNPYLKVPISQLACPISQLASNLPISQKANISTCLVNILQYLKQNEDLIPFGQLVKVSDFGAELMKSPKPYWDPVFDLEGPKPKVPAFFSLARLL